MPKLSEVIRVLEKFAPPKLAQDWDNVGLQIGKTNQEINKILISLDASAQILDEAKNKKCELLLTHHPVFFKGIFNLIEGSPIYDIVNKACQYDVSIYSAHTNLDKAKGGINYVLAKYIDLKDIKPLVYDTDFKKLIFFAERKDSQRIIDTLSKEGAGEIGQYSNSSFRTPGIGTFMPKEGAKPAVGEIGIINEVNEDKIEMLVQSSILDRVLERLIEIHPYEEVAYDVINVEEVKKSQIGLGSIGELNKAMTVKEIARSFAFSSPISIVGAIDKRVKRVAVLGGSGAFYLSHAHKRGAELFITSDIKYHEAQRAREIGLNLIIVSHFAIEKLALELLKPKIAEILADNGYSIEIEIAEKESDIFIESRN